MYKSEINPRRFMSGDVYADSLDKLQKRSHSRDKSILSPIHKESFNGYSGTTEYEDFPVRQFFTDRHQCFPSEWLAGSFNQFDIESYIDRNKNKVIATKFDKYLHVDTCLISLGGKECLYLYFFNKAYGYEDTQKYCVSILFKSKSKRVDNLIKSFNDMIIKEPEEEPSLNILVKTNYGYDLEKKPVLCPDIDFDINYNSDFKKINDLILEKLSIDNSKGLVLLHGLAGTGKTTYIRYLINKLKKRVIFIPPSMASVLAEPELIKFLIDKNNSILVIEDAENVLMKRQGQSAQSVANILNLTDGLLSDCANIQIVATFNTDLKNIDEALLRKGRIIAKYEFTKLEESRSKLLAEKLGLNVNGENTLAEIYNAEDLSFSKEKNKIGFSK